MCLVDGEKAYIQSPEAVEFEQEAFGRYIEQLEAAVVRRVENTPVYRLVLVRMNRRRRYAVCHQALGLVLHECYKGRHHYPHPSDNSAGNW